MNEEYNLIKGVAMRFLRGAVASAISTMALVVTSVTYTQGVTTMFEVRTLVTSLMVAGIIGFITGGILSLDKLYRSV
jgi:hypothetical protein